MRQSPDPHPLLLCHPPALLVLDMQRYFCDPASPLFFSTALEIVDPIARIFNAFREKHFPIFLFRHADREGSLMTRWWGHQMSRNDPLSELFIDRSHGEIIEKHTYDAFHETGLENRLRDMSVKQVVIVGVLSHLCIDTTTRSAFVRGFEPILPVDGIADKNIAHHQSSLAALAHGFSITTTTADLCQHIMKL